MVPATRARVVASPHSCKRSMPLLALVFALAVASRLQPVGGQVTTVGMGACNADEVTYGAGFTGTAFTYWPTWDGAPSFCQGSAYAGGGLCCNANVPGISNAICGANPPPAVPLIFQMAGSTLRCLDTDSSGCTTLGCMSAVTACGTIDMTGVAALALRDVKPQLWQWGEGAAVAGYYQLKQSASGFCLWYFADAPAVGSSMGLVTCTAATMWAWDSTGLLRAYNADDTAPAMYMKYELNGYPQLALIGSATKLASTCKSAAQLMATSPSPPPPPPAQGGSPQGGSSGLALVDFCGNPQNGAEDSFAGSEYIYPMPGGFCSIPGSYSGAGLCCVANFASGENVMSLCTSVAASVPIVWQVSTGSVLGLMASQAGATVSLGGLTDPQGVLSIGPYSVWQFGSRVGTSSPAVYTLIHPYTSQCLTPSSFSFGATLVLASCTNAAAWAWNSDGDGKLFTISPTGGQRYYVDVNNMAPLMNPYTTSPVGSTWATTCDAIPFSSPSPGGSLPPGSGAPPPLPPPELAVTAAVCTAPVQDAASFSGTAYTYTKPNSTCDTAQNGDYIGGGLCCSLETMTAHACAAVPFVWQGSATTQAMDPGPDAAAGSAVYVTAVGTAAALTPSASQLFRWGTVVDAAGTLTANFPGSYNLVHNASGLCLTAGSLAAASPVVLGACDTAYGWVYSLNRGELKVYDPIAGVAYFITVTGASQLKLAAPASNVTQDAWAATCNSAPGGGASAPPSPSPSPPPVPAQLPGGSSSPPSPPLPSAPPSAADGSIAVVSSTATLGGYSVATFGDAQKTAFAATLAANLVVSPSAVTVTGVTAPSTTRHLLQDASSVAVAFEATSLSPSGADALVAGVTQLTASAGAFTAALKAGGLTACTGVTVALPTRTTRASAVQQSFASASVQTAYFDTLLTNLSSLVDANAQQALQLVSGAASALNAATSQLNASAAASFRADLLTTVAAVDTAAASTGALTEVASVVSQLVSNPLQISASGATTALSILSSVSAAGAAVSAGTGNAVTGGLSNLVTAVRNPNNDVGAAVLTQVVNIVGSLAGSLLTDVQANAPPVEVTSAAIQMRVQVDTPGAGSRLFSAPLTANGSASAFAPLPSSLFGGADTSAGVQTQFASFTFDPYDTSDSTGGITRLAFTSAAPGAAPVEVSGLSTPIYFTLPPLTNPLAAGAKPGCTFWDNTTKVYSSTGCAGIPYMRPAGGHVLSWVPGFSVASDAEMAQAWSISGSLMASCAAQLLDCSKDANGKQTSRQLSPNPANPFDFPAINCSAADTSPKIVFVGSQCALIKPDNSLGCSWDNMQQAFVGAGCVPPANSIAQCACRHLTEFASKPTIATASLSDMVGLNPADIVTKLRLLFIVIIVLFGIMNLGALVGFVLDARERRAFVAHLQTEEVGFRTGKDDSCWLWRFSVAPLRGDIDTPTGTAVAIAGLLGLPFARLRTALPDELISWDLASAMGRKDVFSKTGMDAALTEHSEVVPKLFSLCRSAPEADDAEKASADAAFASCEEDERLEEFVGTALVLAFLQVATLMPVAQLAQRVSAAKAHFADFKTPAGWDFGKTQTDFVTLLSPGVLNGTHRWLTRARLWRLILSQSTEGWWDASPNTAFVLESRAATETEHLPTTLFSRVLIILGGIVEVAATSDTDLAGGDERRNDATSALDDVLSSGDQARATGTKEDVDESLSPENATNTPPTASLRRNESMARAAGITDCPLTCSVSAITAAMPRRLSALRAADASIAVTRVWTTMCCISILERMNHNWIWGDGDLYPEQERTIVDGAREWIEAHAAKHPALAAVLEDGAVQEQARKVTMLWRRANEQRVVELRRADGIRTQMNASHVHRTLTGIVHAFTRKHETFATFLSEPLDGLQRWQMFMIIITLIISQLLVNIWMYYSKAVQCCAEVRSILDSGPDGGNCPPVGPCRGFEGNCGQIAEQFASLAVLPDYPNGMSEYVCHLFPDEDKPVDSFIVGLISIAIALPVASFCASCFEIANDNEAPESWLEWVGWRKLVFGLHANHKWHYTGALGQPSRHVKWFIRSVGAPQPETIINLGHSFVAAITGSLPPWTIEAREAAEEEAKAEEAGAAAAEASPAAAAAGSEKAASTTSSVRSARALARYKRIMAATGFIGTYICWAVFTWFIFVYGMLIYKLLGDKAQSEFARSWGISYGLNAAAEWKSILTEAVKGAVILAILERLCMTRSSNWLEEHIDYLSLQSLLFKQTTLGFVGQIKLFFKYTKRVSD